MRGRAGPAIMVTREARVAVMKAVTECPFMAQEEGGGGLAVQAALMSFYSRPLVAAAPDTLAAA